MNERHKQILKTGIAVLAAIGICGWVTYRLLYPDTTVRYNDFVIDSAMEWLENADDGDFDDCRKESIDKDGWFDWFVKDRKSLDKNQSRMLYSRKEKPGPAGMKRYELKFTSKFSNFTYPESKVIEQVIVESDGKKQFKVLMADYPRVSFETVKRPSLSESDRQQIMAIAVKVMKKIEARDIEFFKHEYAKYANRENYFGWNGYWLGQAKNPKVTRALFKILDQRNPTPFELVELEIGIPAGRTGFEAGVVRYRFSTENNGKKENFRLQIFIERDLYQNKSAPWEFYGIWWRQERKK